MRAAGIRTCAADAQLQGAAVLGHSVGLGACGGSHGGHRSGGSFSRYLDGRSEQVDLFSVNVLHVVL